MNWLFCRPWCCASIIHTPLCYGGAVQVLLEPAKPLDVSHDLQALSLAVIGE